MDNKRLILVFGFLIPAVLLLVVAVGLFYGWTRFVSERDLRVAQYEKYLRDRATIQATGPKLPQYQDELGIYSVLLVRDQYSSTAAALKAIEANYPPAEAARTAYREEPAELTVMGSRGVNAAQLTMEWAGRFPYLQQALLQLEHTRPNLVLQRMAIAADEDQNAVGRISLNQTYQALSSGPNRAAAAPAPAAVQVQGGSAPY